MLMVSDILKRHRTLQSTYAENHQDNDKRRDNR